LAERSDKDPKSRLQELAQAQMHHTPRYTTVAESGPDHAKEFTVIVTVGGEEFGQGQGASKQQAAQAAARAALPRLEGGQAPAAGSLLEESPQ
jgi:ribonuclease-3